MARYTGELSLIILNYPTPTMARERVEELRKIGGAVARRSGPLAIVVLGATDASMAERLAAKVNYQATLTLNEANPGAETKRTGQFMLGVFTLAGILMAICVAAGAAFGLIRVIRSKSGRGGGEEAMIRLDL